MPAPTASDIAVQRLARVQRMSGLSDDQVNEFAAAVIALVAELFNSTSLLLGNPSPAVRLAGVRHDGTCRRMAGVSASVSMSYVRMPVCLCTATMKPDSRSLVRDEERATVPLD